MTISRDPGVPPETPHHMIELANEYNLRLICVSCDEAGDSDCPSSPVTFWSLASFIPQRGDRLVLEDRKCCEVKSVLFYVKRFEGEIILVPHVHATLLTSP